MSNIFPLTPRRLSAPSKPTPELPISVANYLLQQANAYRIFGVAQRKLVALGYTFHMDEMKAPEGLTPEQCMEDWERVHNEAVEEMRNAPTP